VPPNVPVVTTVPGDKALAVKGVSVFIPAQKLADGSLSANRVLVGTNGAAPPM
jgi:hypothetical protein